MPPKFVVHEAQRYECRDCPARCCRVPWSIRFGAEEAERFLADPWITLRVGDQGRKVLARGMLPQREHQRRLQCVFLDDDELCSLQKRYGHHYIPRACQAFPFGFLQTGGDRITPQLSQLCPSIRDNYGEPVRGQLKAKLEQRGEVERTSTALKTTTGVILSRPQYLAVAGDWQKALAGDGPVLETLAALADRLDFFEQALPEGERAPEVAVKTARRKAAAFEPEPLPAIERPSFHARALYAYLLGNLCYPSRLRQPQRVGARPWFAGLRSARNKSAWMRGRGTVDLLFVPEPVPLDKVAAVEPFLAGPEGRAVGEYLAGVVERGNLFVHPRYLRDSLIDLCFAAVLVSRFARCRAAAAGRTEVAGEDVREGISVCELVHLHHVVMAEEGKTMQNLRSLMLADRDKLRLLLASEA